MRGWASKPEKDSAISIAPSAPTTVNPHGLRQVKIVVQIEQELRPRKVLAACNRPVGGSERRPAVSVVMTVRGRSSCGKLM